jgi:hypothetical protein
MPIASVVTGASPDGSGGGESATKRPPASLKRTLTGSPLPSITTAAVCAPSAVTRR